MAALVAGLFLSPASLRAQDENREPAPGAKVPGGKADTRHLDLDALMKATETAPIVFPKTSISARDFKKQKLSWLKREIYPVINRELQGALDDRAQAAVVDRLAEWWTGVDGESKSEDVYKDVAALIPADREAPVTQSLVAALASRVDKTAEAVARWKIALEHLDAKKGPAIAGVWTAEELLARHQISLADAKTRKQVEDFVEAALSAGQCTEANAPFVVHFFMDYSRESFFKPMGDKILATLDQSEAPRWARLAIMGQVEIDRAWAARGNAWANEVTDKGWKGFAGHLEKAGEELSESWKLRPDRPEAAAGMLSVAMGGGPDGKVLRQWFDRATAAQCDYTPAYERMLWALRPRWGGSIAEMLAFGVACARAGRPETAVGEQLSYALYGIVSEGSDWESLFRQPEIAALLVKTRQAMSENAVTSADRMVRTASLALEAWMCQDYAAAAKAYDKLGYQPKMPFLVPYVTINRAHSLHLDVFRAADESHALASKWGKEYGRARSEHDAGQLESAAQKVAEIVKDPEALKLPAIEGLMLVTQLEQDLPRPGWHAVPIHAYTCAWAAGHWQIPPDELQGFCEPNQVASQFLESDLGDRYELRATVKLPASVLVWGWGFFVGARHADAGGGKYCVCTSDHKTAKFRLGTGTEMNERGGAESKSFAAPADGTFAVRVRREKDKISVWIGEQLVMDKADLGEAASGPGAFGFVATCGTTKDRVIFSHVEAKRAGEEL